MIKHPKTPFTPEQRERLDSEPHFLKDTRRSPDDIEVEYEDGSISYLVSETVLRRLDKEWEREQEQQRRNTIRFRSGAFLAVTLAVVWFLFFYQNSSDPTTFNAKTELAALVAVGFLVAVFSELQNGEPLPHVRDGLFGLVNFFLLSFITLYVVSYVAVAFFHRFGVRI